MGLGVRLDTGVNVGKEGARVCFLGMGGELVLDDVTKLKKKKDARSPQAPVQPRTARSSPRNGIGSFRALSSVAV